MQLSHPPFIICSFSPSTLSVLMHASCSPSFSVYRLAYQEQEEEENKFTDMFRRMKLKMRGEGGRATGTLGAFRARESTGAALQRAFAGPGGRALSGGSAVKQDSRTSAEEQRWADRTSMSGGAAGSTVGGFGNAHTAAVSSSARTPSPFTSAGAGRDKNVFLDVRVTHLENLPFQRTLAADETEK